MPDGTTLSKHPEIGLSAWADPGARKLAFGVVPAFRRFELRQARYLDLVPGLVALGDNRSDLKILDIGSGKGAAKQFADHAGVRGDWSAIEIDPRRVALCRRLGYRRILDSHNLESGPLPFSDGAFDVVIASHILEHLLDDAEALNDWYRVLAPGGVLYLGVPMHLGSIAGLARWRYRRVGRKPYGHCQFYSLRSLNRLLAGFPVTSIRGFRAFSARKHLPLEDFEWFFKASIRFGRRWPGLTQEVNVEIRKPLA